MRKSGARKALATLVILACVAFIGAGIARDFDTLELDEMNWGPLARAGAVLLAAYVIRALAFGVLVRTMDHGAPILTAARVFLGSQLGRYIPGKVWQVAGAGYFASQVGISATAALVGTAYYVVIHNLIGGLLGLGVFLRTAERAGTSGALIVPAVVGVLVVVFASSPAFPALIQHVGRLVGKQLDVRPISVWAVLLTVASSLAVWSLFGVAVVEVFRGTLPGAPAPALGASIATIAAASVAGLAVLIVPSGIGVREAVFVAAFAGTYTVAEGGIVALVLRILMSGIELVLAVISLLGIRGTLQATEQDEAL
jgi:uncharacterized membrane protein YbhN (UPF0104 family)